MQRLITILTTLAVALPLWASEGNPTTRQRELIVELLELTNTNRTASAMLDAMLSQTEQSIIQNASAGGTEEYLDEAKELIANYREELAGIDIGGLMSEAMIRIYAKHFSERELEDLIAFYRTPTGAKSLEVLPVILREGAEAGAELLAPPIDAAFNRARDRVEQKRPWRRTMADIRTIATAIEAWSIDSDDQTYPRGDYASLEALLVPDYLAAMPDRDMWGTPYAYTTSPDGAHYRIVSAGSDTIFEWDSRNIKVDEDGEVGELRYREHLEDDIIYADGRFLQLPVQVKPKNDDSDE